MFEFDEHLLQYFLFLNTNYKNQLYISIYIKTLTKMTTFLFHLFELKFQNKKIPSTNKNKIRRRVLRSNCGQRSPNYLIKIKS